MRFPDNASDGARPDARGHEPLAIWFLVDRSGSMRGLAPAVVEGFNAFLDEQRAVASDAPVTLTFAQFDDADPFEVVIDAVPLREVVPLEPSQFEPRGRTPLYDAIASLFDAADWRVEQRVRAGAPAEDQLVVVFSDGLENASRRAGHAQVFDRIAERRRAGWTVVFLGANQDSYATGGHMGLSRGNTSNFPADLIGTEKAFRSVSRATTTMRFKASDIRKATSEDFFDGRKEAEEGD